jgi:hypothetical protein
VAAERAGVSVALSHWCEAQEAGSLQLERAGLPGPGTTLLIPAFHEPDRDDVGSLGIREPEDLCRGLTEAAAKWFWPAISWGRLRVRARVLVSGESRARFESQAEVGGLWAPFLAATRVEPGGPAALSPGDSAAIDITGFPLPRRIQPEERPDLLHPPLEATIRVAVTRVSPSEASLPCRCTIALIRGAGMVVDYAEGLRLHDGGNYCAVALVGTAMHHTPPSQALEDCKEFSADAEEYFRAAEPVTHDDWLPTTRRLRESYDWRGSSGRLRGLRGEIRQLLQIRLLSSDEPAPDAGPDLLMRMLSLGEGVSPVAAAARGEKPRLEVRVDREGSWYDRERGGWALHGELIRHGRGEGPATAGLSFRSIADSGQGECWRISGIEIHGPEENLSMDDTDGRRLVFSVDTGFTAVPFRCLVRPPQGVDPALTGFRQGG